MKLVTGSKSPGRRLRRLLSAPVALMASACLLAATVPPPAEAGPVRAPFGTTKASRAVDPDFGPVKSESIDESAALDAMVSTAEMTLNTLSQLAAAGRLDLPEADVKGAELKRLLRRAAIRMAALDEDLSEQMLRSRAVRVKWDHMERLFDKIGPDDQFKGSPKLKAEDLQAGDVFVSTTDAVISQAIKVASWGQYSHAALYVGNGQVIDATAKGVTQRSLREFLTEASRVGVLRVKRLNRESRERLVGNARKLVGREYNYRGLAGMALDRMACFVKNTLDAVRCLRSVASVPKAFMGKDSYFCSQLVDNVLRNSGIKLFRNNGATPIDFVNLAVRGGSTTPINIVGRLK